LPHSTYLPEKMGHAVVEPQGRFEAGSYQSFTVTYTAGHFGIDDTGSIKIVHRFASDMGRPQFDDPKAPNYVTVVATNGAVLHVEYDMKRNIRPWDKTIYIKVVRGFLREGDQIIVKFGDRSGGSPGIRLQTFCEETFEFRVLVDPIAVYNYVELPQQPEIKIVPGKPVLWKAIMPTLRRVGEKFRLSIKGEDRWGNPSDLCDQTLFLHANQPVEGLPESITFPKGEFAVILDELKVMSEGDLIIELLLDDVKVATSNPLRIQASAELLPFWGDLHGQSEETIGTNSARDFHKFARDCAFLDVAAHQGNDFQITTEFWNHLNVLTKEFTEDHRFITFPGYEWSGNTGVGGDRNILFLEEGHQIHRSSHALVNDLSDVDTDATDAKELFKKLKGKDCVVFAHIGGRYADIEYCHDEQLERGVEVHSAWGSFEWLINDAFNNGYRVGILSNSDGHKGRPGASHPGATKFGSYGGLTCMLATELTRQGIADSLRKRHHYGTTGCRMVLDVHVKFDNKADLFENDPLLGNDDSQPVNQAMMGDILRSSDASVTLVIDAHASSPIERIDIRNGVETLAVLRPYKQEELGRRIRVTWEGSEYRGRGRETFWDGNVKLEGNKFETAKPINRYNLDKRFDQSDDAIEWTSITTGGHAGFDALLVDADAGTLVFDTAPIKIEIPIADIGYEEKVYDAGGLDRKVRIFRLPDENTHKTFHLEQTINLVDDRDNALYVRITQEDGHVIWSSPIYIFR